MQTTLINVRNDVLVVIKAKLAEKFDVQIKVEEKIQEDLMAGLVFKLGSLEVDGSLLNRYQEAAAEVKKTAGV